MSCVLPDSICMVPHISKTEWDLMQQKRIMAMTVRTATMTLMPTKTVAARNAGDKMLAKSSRRPTHCTDDVSSSLPRPSDNTVQNLKRQSRKEFMNSYCRIDPTENRAKLFLSCTSRESILLTLSI